MFDLQLFKNNTAVITDRGETLTYSELQKEVDIFYTHIPSNSYFAYVKMFWLLLLDM